MTARTSQTHPLQIAAIVAGPDMGRVGLTFCPGKVQPNAATGAWERDLWIDLDAIAKWGAVTVISLVEQHELEDLGVPALGAEVAARHMDWLHLPIRDAAVPGPAFEKAWAEVGEGIRARLRSGFNVLVHCKGGLGRAGVVACKILIEMGMASEIALEKVRAERPGAVETEAQEAYVLGLKPIAEARPAVSKSAIVDRGLGAFLGLAVGDAVGTTLEFVTRDSKPPLTDMIGGGPFKLEPGQWTDDTAMAVALAECLDRDATLDPLDLMARFVAWREQGAYSCTGRCFDIGITTSAALRRFQQTGDPYAGATDSKTAGNGSLMRLSPVALAHWKNRAMLADVAARQSQTTHGAAEAIDACVLYAAIIADAIAGLPRSEVLRRRAAKGSPAIQAIANGRWRGRPREAIRSSGYVVHSLEAALWCVGRTADFRSAVLLAANLGDDADTTAAIAGQLAGALYGLSGIPEEWLDKLAWRERLEAVGRSLLA